MKLKETKKEFGGAFKTMGNLKIKSIYTENLFTCAFAVLSLYLCRGAASAERWVVRVRAPKSKQQPMRHVQRMPINQRRLIVVLFLKKKI